VGRRTVEGAAIEGASRRIDDTAVVHLSRIGLGLAALGRPGYQNVGHGADIGSDASVEAMRRRTHEVLDAAWEGGIRYIDTARSYGRAEEFLASWIAARGIDPEKLTVGSKWGYRYTAGWRVQTDVHEVKDYSLAALREQLAESRRLLGAHLHLYQIHSATLESGVLDDSGVLDELARLRDSGLRVGLTLSGARQADTLARAMEIERGGRRVFESVQATWNLLEPSIGEPLRQARAAGMFVIVKEVLANGHLVRGDDARYGDARRVVAREADRLETNADTLAIAAGLAQPWADVVLSGAATVHQLESNLATKSIALTDDVLGRLRDLAVDPQDYWSYRAKAVWT
jgi:aryl-alcohol dehydrogenase-like predicted oxidoreductase